LIHMNGRAYDPELGRFLSVDPFIQFPDNSQSLNPYTYVMNNPLSGTDPTGYVSERFLGRGATVIFDRTLGIGMGNTPLQFNTNTANITPDVLTPIEPNEMGVIVSDHVIKIGVGKDWTLVITKPASGAVVTLNVKTEEKIEGKVAPAVKQGTSENTITGSQTTNGKVRTEDVGTLVFSKSERNEENGYGSVKTCLGQPVRRDKSAEDRR